MYGHDLRAIRRYVNKAINRKLYAHGVGQVRRSHTLYCSKHHFTRHETVELSKSKTNDTRRYRSLLKISSLINLTYTFTKAHTSYHQQALLITFLERNLPTRCLLNPFAGLIGTLIDHSRSFVLVN